MDGTGGERVGAMLNPPHLGELIRESMDEVGWNVTEAAAHLGCERGTLSRLLNGKAGVSAKMALALEALGWGTADHGMDAQCRRGYELAQQPDRMALSPSIGGAVRSRRTGSRPPRSADLENAGQTWNELADGPAGRANRQPPPPHRRLGRARSEHREASHPSTYLRDQGSGKRDRKVSSRARRAFGRRRPAGRASPWSRPCRRSSTKPCRRCLHNRPFRR